MALICLLSRAAALRFLLIRPADDLKRFTRSADEDGDASQPDTEVAPRQADQDEETVVYDSVVDDQERHVTVEDDVSACLLADDGGAGTAGAHDEILAPADALAEVPAELAPVRRVVKSHRAPRSAQFRRLFQRRQRSVAPGELAGPERRSRRDRRLAQADLPDEQVTDDVPSAADMDEQDPQTQAHQTEMVTGEAELESAAPAGGRTAFAAVLADLFRQKPTGPRPEPDLERESERGPEAEPDQQPEQRPEPKPEPAADLVPDPDPTSESHSAFAAAAAVDVLPDRSAMARKIRRRT